MKDIHDVIKRAKFGDDRLRGSGVVAGQISAFPIDFVGRPYNTLTLPCERVNNASILYHFRDIASYLLKVAVLVEHRLVADRRSDGQTQGHG